MKREYRHKLFLNKSYSIKQQLTNRLTDIIERLVVFHLSHNLSQSKSSPLPKF